MKNIYFIIFLLLLFSKTNAQENIVIDYFPVEQLIHPDCSDSEDPNKCLNTVIYKMVHNELAQLKSSIKTYCDTLKIAIRFNVAINGEIIKENTWTSVNDSIIREQIYKHINTDINKLPALEIKNRKTELYPSYHNLAYYFTRKSGNEYIQVDIPESRIYNGGEVEQTPLFSESHAVSNLKDRQDFQYRIQEHIKANFRYPAKAQRNKIQGKVNIIFKIDKTGEVIDIRTKGPDIILEEEAQRIISKLKKFIPGTINGDPVIVPYSIPITFKLN